MLSRVEACVWLASPPFDKLAHPTFNTFLHTTTEWMNQSPPDSFSIPSTCSAVKLKPSAMMRAWL